MLISAPRRGSANTFNITLTVAAGDHKQTASSAVDIAKDHSSPVRPAMQAAPGQRFTARWKVTCIGKEPLKDVLVHFYVVRIDKLGQAPPALEPQEVVIESAQTMDFAAGSTTSAELQFKPDHAGIYLIRVEAQGAADGDGHEDFAALDLVVKEGESK
jgi:hypothetical protein